MILFSELKTSGNRTKTRMFQYGIVSLGIKCGGPPAIYTNVEHYIDWIIENIDV
jgi:secreted trypsin-like serine protease